MEFQKASRVEHKKMASQQQYQYVSYLLQMVSRPSSFTVS